MNVIAHIIVAAGSGSRFGATLPKQYCELAGRPVVMTTIERFRRATPDALIILVINPAHEELWHDLCSRHDFTSPVTVYGGATRWESVKNAISQINASAQRPDIITVHDGARPCIDTDLITRVTDAIAQGHSCAIPVTPVVESLRLISSDGQSQPVDRSRYRAVQTPQAFNARLLTEAYRLPYSTDFTDDASVMAAAGYNDTVLVDGDPRNIKITHPDDLAIASIYLSR